MSKENNMQDLNLRATCISFAIDSGGKKEAVLPLAQEIYSWLRQANDEEGKVAKLTPVN